jgi:hypothetical protein
MTYPDDVVIMWRILQNLKEYLHHWSKIKIRLD